MIDNVLKDIVLDNLGRLRNTNKGWLSRNCMLCHLKGESIDKRNRFGLKLNTDGSMAIRCFNCNYRAKYTPGKTLSKPFDVFLRQIGVSHYQIQKLNFEMFKESIHSNISLPEAIHTDITDSWKTISFPEVTKSLGQWADEGTTDECFIDVVKYAISRNITDFDSIYWCTSSENNLNKRMLIPFYHFGNLIGYTGRYYGQQPNKFVTKYKNILPSDYIYNLDNQRSSERKYAILCEGVLDAYFVDGMSAHGNTLNDEQAELINRLHKKVIVCPDKDKDGKLLVAMAIKHGWGVSFPKWGHGIKDAAESVGINGKLLTVAAIVKWAEFDPLKIQVLWNIEQSFL